MFFSKNRDKLFSLMKNNSIAVIYTNTAKQRSNDTDFPFRQNSNFYYLTGFLEDSAILVMIKKEGLHQSILFLHPKDPLKEMWEGKRLGVEKSVERLGIDQSFDIKDFETELVSLVRKTQTLYVQAHDTKSISVVHTCKQAKDSHLFPLVTEDIDALVLRLRRKKQPYEIKMIKEALALTKKAHHAAMALASPSKYEYEIMALVEYLFKSGGASGDAYTSIVAGGNNANVLHYIENNNRLRDGDLILMDAGSEFALYASDITRTFPVNGKFSTPQKELYNMVLQTQKEVIAEIKPGVLRSDLSDKAIRMLSGSLKEIGVLHQSLDEIVENELYKPYYPHGIGHWMGLDVHDPVAYKDANDKEYAFETGDVLTVEPGLYLDASDESIPKAFRGIGIRIEDNILLTDKGHENLSSEIVKEVEDIETLCEKNIYDYI